jgi:hypothetical protein
MVRKLMQRMGRLGAFHPEYFDTIVHLAAYGVPDYFQP